MQKKFCRRCDLRTCMEPSTNTSMKILHGCGHSFHKECFPSGYGICCICKDALITAISHLASSAEEAIFNPKRSESSENRDDGCEADIDDNEDDDDEEVIMSESNGSTSIADAQLQLQQEVFSWGLVPGPDT